MLSLGGSSLHIRTINNRNPSQLPGNNVRLTYGVVSLKGGARTQGLQGYLPWGGTNARPYPGRPWKPIAIL